MIKEINLIIVEKEIEPVIAFSGYRLTSLISGNWRGTEGEYERRFLDKRAKGDKR